MGGQTIIVDPKISMRFDAGLGCTKIEYDLSTHATRENIEPDLDQRELFLNHSDFSGIGPVISIDASYNSNGADVVDQSRFTSDAGSIVLAGSTGHTTAQNNRVLVT